MLLCDEMVRSLTERVDNYRLKEAQEMLEAAMARYSRDVATSNKTVMLQHLINWLILTTSNQT